MRHFCLHFPYIYSNKNSSGVAMSVIHTVFPWVHFSKSFMDHTLFTLNTLVLEFPCRIFEFKTSKPYPYFKLLVNFPIINVDYIVKTHFTIGSFNPICIKILKYWRCVRTYSIGKNNSNIFQGNIVYTSRKNITNKIHI